MARGGVNPLLALATGLLLIAIHPGLDLVWLAPAALAPLLIALAREPRPLRRFLLGYGAGVVYWFGVCYWIQFVLAVHGNLGEAGGWAVFLLFALAKALHMGVFALLAGAVMPRVWALPAVAALWTGIERTHAPLGFAWLALGNAGAGMSVPLRLAPFTGVYGLSFVFALMGTAIALVLLRRRRRELAWLGLLAPLYVLPELPPPERGAESAVVVQPNIAEDTDWTRPAVEELERRLAYLSLQQALAAGQAPPGIILWPEMPAPLYYDDPFFARQVDALARLTRTPVLFGTVARTRQGAPLNAAQLVDAAGRPVDRYDKIKLVPFGEFVPPFFEFVNRITKESGDFVPGSRLVVLPAGQRRVGAFICYESAFPHLVRRFAAGGADLLVNLSNDGYFGRTAARAQHLKLVRMRAAENRRWILRVTNDGVTAAIDPAGRLMERLPPYVEKAARMRYSGVGLMTAYTRLGDWFAWGCLAAGLAMWLAAGLPAYRARDIQ